MRFTVAGIKEWRQWVPHWRFNFGLRSQILALGTSGVAIVGAIYLVGLQVENAAIRRSENSVALQELVAGAAEKFIEARQVAVDFARTRGEPLIQRHNDLIAGVRDNLEKIDKLVAALPEDDPLRKATAWRAGLNDYVKRFNGFVATQRLLGLTDNDGLLADLSTAAQKIDTELAKFEGTQLTVLLLRMRRNEKDFMLRGDEAFGKEVKKYYQEFGTALKAADMPEPQKKEIQTNLRTYYSSFDDYLSGQQTLIEEGAEMASIFDTVVRPQLVAVEKITRASADSAKHAMMQVRHSMMWALALTMLAVIAVTFFVGRRLAGPLTAMAGAMRRLADGDMEIAVPTTRRDDEIGVMARAFAVFHGKMLENRDLAAGQAAERQRAEADRHALLTRIATQLQADVGAAVEMVVADAVRMHQDVAVVGQVLEETQERAGAVGAASAQASENVQRIAAATEELAASMSEVAEQVKRHTDIARRAASNTERSDAIVRSLITETQQVEEIVVLINTIASQTNLLALNATIEAARAGEAGRGFAVVAQEVKALAQQVTSATDNIRQQIDRMRGSASQAGDAINDIGSTVREIDQMSSAMADAIAQQQAATQEISGSINIAAGGTQTVSENMGKVDEDARQACSLAEQMASTAAAMRTQSGALNTVIARFVDQIRAA